MHASFWGQPCHDAILLSITCNPEPDRIVHHACPSCIIKAKEKESVPELSQNVLDH